MRTKGILSFFITVICCFCIADAVFASYAKEKAGAADESVFAVRVDGASKMTRYGARAEYTDIRDSVSGLSKTPAVSGTRYSLIGHTSEMFKVLSVLKKRVGDERLLKKIEDKLPALSDDRLRMMVSLSERIAADNHGAKTDIAFLLLTTLIIFS